MNCHGHGRNQSIFQGAFSKLYQELYMRMCIRDIQIHENLPSSTEELRGDAGVPGIFQFCYIWRG